MLQEKDFLMGFLEPYNSKIFSMLHFHGRALQLRAQYARLSDCLLPKWLLAPYLEALELVAQTIT